MKAPEFIAMLFLARDVAHSVHLNTRSYARHKALDEFYHDIIDKADGFAEAYQGRHGLIGPIPRGKVVANADIVKFLQDQLSQIAAGRAKIAEESALQNIIDEIVALYASTLYKLRFLS